MKILLLETGISNVASIGWALEDAGYSVRRISEPSELTNDTPLVMPGVGSFSTGAARLLETGWFSRLQQASKDTPILGICLGMQLLLSTGEEHGKSEGLGLIDGTVKPISSLGETAIQSGLRRFNTGWRQISSEKLIHEPFQDSQYAAAHRFVYFNHSFFCDVSPEYIVASVEGIPEIPAIIRSGIVTGFQFHPELSGELGLEFLRTWGDSL